MRLCHLGKTNSLSDSNGQVVWKADYSPFGNGAITSSVATFYLRFPGLYHDVQTSPQARARRSCCGSYLDLVYVLVRAEVIFLGLFVNEL